MQSLKNTVVTVSCYGGSTAQMIVIEELGGVLVVCSEEEWGLAQAEGREPNTLGFPRESVVAPKNGQGRQE